MKFAMNPKAFQANYGKVKSEPGELWSKIKGVSGEAYDWPTSTYIAEPPFFDASRWQPSAHAAGGAPGVTRRAHHGAVRRLDHHRPHLAGGLDQGHARRPASGCWHNGVLKPDFNSYGSRRGNHEVMMRGTFANVRIKNLMMPAGADGSREEGGVTLYRNASGRREDVHLRRRDALHRRGHAHGDLRGRGIRHRLVARLGGQGDAAAGHQGRGGARASSASTAATWSAWACCRCSSRPATRSGSRWA